MPSIFVFLDTNILIRIATQGQPGCEKERWEELRKLADDSRVTILIPEIVQLEFTKHARSFLDDFAKGIAAFETKVNDLAKHEEKDPYWNETRDLITAFKVDLNSSWKTSRDNKVAACRRGFANIGSWLRSQAVKQLPFDEQILLRAKRRLIAGRFPKRDSTGWTQQQKADRLLDGDCDFCIIDSLICHFEQANGDNELLFCTANLKDFGLETKDGGRIVHPLFREGLPPSEIFTDLASLIDFINTNRPIQEPKAEDIEEALKETTIKETLPNEMDWQRISTSIMPDPSQHAETFWKWTNVAGVWTFGLTDSRRAVKRVNVLVKNTLDQFVQVGTVVFFRLPIQNPDDYGWSGLPLRFDQAKEISGSLMANVVRGRIDHFEWWAD
jgi:predicted nucleic acid-binding protein